MESSKQFIETGSKKLLDKFFQPSYNETEAICLSSQSVQVNDKKLRVFGVSCLNFCTMCTLRLFKTSGFCLYKLKRAYKSFKTV
ncbi:MAG: hypothetical protein PG978_000860 [Wolbachia endosymbiont of Ctenocephalides felis wCfeF]|nr:MAG: hypothetical protein PG978_000860 [Wolbachia endosymbiont of Ctenocephalides felis wCfeF]